MILLAWIHFLVLIYARVEGVQFGFESAVTDEVVKCQGLVTFS